MFYSISFITEMKGIVAVKMGIFPQNAVNYINISGTAYVEKIRQQEDIFNFMVTKVCHFLYLAQVF